MGHASYGNHSGTDGGRPDEKATQRKKEKDSGSAPPAPGPHSKEDLTNPNATPGTGVLPPVGAEDGTDSTSG